MLVRVRARRPYLSPLTIGFVCLLAIAGRGSAQEPPTAQQLEFFETSIRPLLVKHCYACHSVSAEKLQGGLYVDSRDGLLRGGDSGPAIDEQDVEVSLLIQAVRYESFEMPPKGRLANNEIEALEQWVEMGAPWPKEAIAAHTASANAFDLTERKADHWAWQPVQPLTLPVVSDRNWPRNELDHFVLAKLEAASLAPAADADRNALLRRIYFDLIGLPPTAEQANAFLSDDRPDAVERLVDQLLSSPRFGERWGRHWLDLVRYAESRGHEFDNDSPNAYQYRDYIIRAFNADIPYDQMVREHLAGDLLDPPRLNPQSGFNESILGTGFWFLGEWVHSPVDIRKDETDRFDNMIDVMSKTFLGVTVACARCHDHKFDAISTADYYSLCGFLQSSDYRQVRFESLEHNRQVAQKLSELDANYRRQIEACLGSELPLPQHDEPAAALTIDYARLNATDWLQDGFLFGDRPRRAGEVYLDETGDRPQIGFARRSAAVSDPFWNGLQAIGQQSIQNKDATHKLPKSGRTLRTPTFTLEHGKVVCRVRGSGHVVACVDSHRLVAGPLHHETIQVIKPDQPWIELKLDRYIGHRLHLEFTPDQDASLEISQVWQGATPADLHAMELYESRIEQVVQQHERGISQRLAVDDRASQDIERIVQAWADARAELKQTVRLQSHLAMAMMDGTAEDEHILIRGNSSNPGKQEPRHFLTAIAGDQPMQIARGSGRRELADQINDPSNPLSSRVITNRIWHWLMGRGIVPTTDDFGVLGQRPTHPELLDHLTARFLQDGRSIKQLIRYIVSSRTYQLSSHGRPDAIEADPKNLLWHHRPLKRLEGEAIRDSLLVIADSLDATMFGESVPIHLTPFMEGRGRPGVNGPLDGNGRRSVYIAVRRNFLSPFMLAFDTPTPFSTMGRRNVSNVPAQALILMNDPLVVELAGRWAARTLDGAPQPAAEAVALQQEISAARLESMYVAAFARRPTEQEQQAAAGFLSAQAAALNSDLNDQRVWAALAHALINTKEFIFLR
ncbi:MAG: PSD1 and planctomycete cytochrome C domain-containing protein [Planctomycetaceae bacterium]